MKIKKYAARNVPVLNLTRRPDSTGEIIPPECYVVFKNPVPVIYDYDYTKIIGKAYLMRVQNQIVADLQVVSGIEDAEEAKILVQEMHPAISGRVNERYENHVFGLEITGISLSYNRNCDEFITKLGDRVTRVRKTIR